MAQVICNTEVASLPLVIQDTLHGMPVLVPSNQPALLTALSPVSSLYIPDNSPPPTMLHNLYSFIFPRDVLIGTQAMELCLQPDTEISLLARLKLSANGNFQTSEIIKASATESPPELITQLRDSASVIKVGQYISGILFLILSTILISRALRPHFHRLAQLLRPAPRSSELIRISILQNNAHCTTPEPEVAGDEMCVVCLSAGRVMACVPCGHKVMCSDCSKLVAGRRMPCPVCRNRIDMMIRIYDA
eukprot:c9024_g1_i2.p1 GENE.c9024_g1_i2~~c9024_g1_i2.p1  ORF type:complete len:248 (+),score=35.87 c9024_g1_i2:422-1165(+)